MPRHTPHARRRRKRYASGRPYRRRRYRGTARSIASLERMLGLDKTPWNIVWDDSRFRRAQHGRRLRRRKGGVVLRGEAVRFRRRRKRRK